ncbi:MAG: ATP-binding protein [Anaerolineae bacterium]|nr:ATP-binding protein [Anaerolineae bacterium]
MDFLTVFVRPPGDLIYFILVVGIILACLLMTIGQHIRESSRVTARFLIGLSLALLGWVALLVWALTSLAGVGSTITTLPLVERAATLTSIVVLGWVFITADHTQWRQRSTFFVLLTVIAVIALYTVPVTLNTANDSETAFVWGIVWASVPLVLLAFLIITIVSHWQVILDAPLKLVWAGILLSGYTLALMQYLQADVLAQVGAGRLAFAAAATITATLVYRAMLNQLSQVYDIKAIALKQQAAFAQKPFNSANTAPSAPPPPAAAASRPAPSARASLAAERDSVQLLRALGLMIEDTSPKQLPQKIVKAVTEMMRADVGGLIRAQDVNYADVVFAFDRGRNRTLPGVSINLENQPTLRNAIERGQQRPLLADRNEEELQDLYPRLNIETVGPTYLQPLTKRGGEVIAVLLLGYPFANRELTDAEIESLRGVGVIAGGLLALSDEAEEARQLSEERAIQAMARGIPLSQISDDQVQSGRHNAYIELQMARSEISGLQSQLKTLEDRLGQERSRLARALGDSGEDLSLSQRIVAINQEQLTLRDERAKLIQRLQQLESTLIAVGKNGEDKALKTALTALRRERDELANQRDKLQAQLEALIETGTDRASAQAAVAEMGSESSVLSQERDQLLARLNGLESELRQHGVDPSASGVSQLIGALSQQQADLQAKVSALETEREAWSRKVEQLNQRLASVRDPETRLNDLQRSVQNLAVDRDTAMVQLEKTRKQRDELALRVQKFNEYRERATATIDGLRQEIAALRQNPGTPAATVTPEKPITEGRSSAIAAELSRTMARVSDLERELRAARSKTTELSKRRSVRQEQIDAMIGLAQELRTPLTSITGYLDLLVKESVGILGDMQRRFVQRVIANAQRLGGMVDDMVRLAALDAGRVQFNFEPVDVVALVEQAITDVSTGLREKGIEVELNAEDDIPTISADAEAVKQIVGQTLTNAYLASPVNSIIRVSVAPNLVTDQRAGVIIRVQDSGVGVPPESADEVFKRRYESENPLLPGLGDTGVAMAVAKALTEAHNGLMWIDSGDSSGTTINITLPAG